MSERISEWVSEMNGEKMKVSDLNFHFVMTSEQL